MKSIVWTWRVLVCVAFPLVVSASPVRGAHERVFGDGQGDGRLCLELMELGEGQGDGDNAMELPPLKSERTQVPPAQPALRLKSLPGEENRAPGSSRDPGVPPSSVLSPSLLSGPGGRTGSEKPSLKALVPDRGREGVGAGERMPGELKPPEPVAAPGGGLKLAPAGRRDVAGPLGVPEIPLLRDDPKDPAAFDGDSGRKALTLKPARASTPEVGGGPQASAFPVLAGAPAQPFGSDLDDRLLAVYEKYYKNRK